VDIYYDHFLARNWTKYSNTALEFFAEEFYDLLRDNFDLLPTGVKRMMPYMIADNWLVNYADIEGIGRVLDGMNRRTDHKSGMGYAVEELQEHYEAFEDEFTRFFKELRAYALNEYKILCE
jgi:acyl carrier protein phosphodiesterase